MAEKIATLYRRRRHVSDNEEGCLVRRGASLWRVAGAVDGSGGGGESQRLIGGGGEEEGPWLGVG